MAKIKAFRAIRPTSEHAHSIAALPYDVYTRAEARKAVSANPLSFLKIDRAESLLPEDVDLYSDLVYKTAFDTFQKMCFEHYFIEESAPCYYLYELTMDNRTQTGLVSCAAVDDYVNGVIKKHENTLPAKELDRTRHIESLSAQTGPIFLTYRSRREITDILRQVKTTLPLYDFTAEDQVTHRAWKIDDPAMIHTLTEEFARIPALYIADGHHRAASAVRAALAQRSDNPKYTGDEEFNYFLSVLFPQEELTILPYQRLVHDLNGHTEESFLAALEQDFIITPFQNTPYAPEKPLVFGMCLGGTWYRLAAKIKPSDDVVACLDVSVLQDQILNPVLGIKHPKTDTRISFIGGIKGLDVLTQETLRYPLAVAFSLYPTQMEQLLDTADAGQLMPPKSTWFEPKLRSGLFIHKI